MRADRIRVSPKAHDKHPCTREDSGGHVTAEAEPAVMKPQPRGARGHPELEGAKRGKTPRLGAFGGSGAQGGKLIAFELLAS